jgi:hypothetical protein
MHYGNEKHYLKGAGGVLIPFLEILVKVPFKIRLTTNFELISAMGFGQFLGSFTVLNPQSAGASARRPRRSPAAQASKPVGVCTILIAENGP